jgi:DNA-binding transcriptional LysR family regulator
MRDEVKLDLNLLSIVVALLDAGSASQAALDLGLSQSAVSGALARLRAHFNDPLFVRSANGMAPTPRGAEVAGVARDILRQVAEHLRPDLEFNPSSARRPFTFALSDVGEMVFLPKLLQALGRTAPDAPVRSVTLRPAQLAKAMEDGDVDLAIGFFPDLRKSDFFQQRLLTHHFVCLLRADHAVRGRRLTLGEFLSLEHVVVHSEGRSQEIFEEFLQARGLTRRIRLYTPHFLSIARLVSQSDMLVTVPHAIGMEYGRPELGLRVIEPPFESPRIELKQHWHRKVHKDPRHQWLRKLVSELFNEDTDEW